jgi:hypothetical protein
MPNSAAHALNTGYEVVQHDVLMCGIEQRDLLLAHEEDIRRESADNADPPLGGDEHHAAASASSTSHTTTHSAKIAGDGVHEGGDMIRERRQTERRGSSGRHSG